MHVSAPEQAAPLTHQRTLADNLRVAYQNELNGHASYLGYARAAARDGWHGVAGLLRALAAAERIHAANHGRILRQLGGDVDATPTVNLPRGTIENLRSALAAELYEMNTMYPEFIEQARGSGEPAVIRTLTWALKAEKAHARLLNEALTLVEFDDRDAWVTMVREFYVCPVCGYTSAVADEQPLCPACNCAWMRFEAHH